jgi:hypothetical protein
MTATPERLDAITARLASATNLGLWETTRANDVVIYDPNGFGAYRRIAHAEVRDDAKFIANARADVAYLLDLARKQAAALERVERLAIGWTLRGESDMEFSKRIPDPDIAIEILTNGAQMVENGRAIRAALEATP